MEIQIMFPVLVVLKLNLHIRVKILKIPFLRHNAVYSDIVEVHADRLEDGRLSCKLCRHLTHKTYNMRLHLEGKHDGLSAGYLCDLCHAVFKTKHLLRHHRLKCLQHSTYQ